MVRRKKLGAVISALVNGAVLSVPAGVSAQEGLEEVIVTATRRSESVQDVPYNISAYSSEELERALVNDFSDFSRMVAGLSYIDQGPDVRGNVNTFILRGLGGSAANANAGVPRVSTSPVSTYVGETPVFFPLTVTDLERVEVLRGPQGTLYGSGSTGGTIRFIPNRPDTKERVFDISGDVSGTSYSDDVNYAGDVVANFPFNEDLALRFSAGYRKRGGFIDGNALLVLGADEIPVLADPADVIGSPPVLQGEQEDINESESWHTRAALLWEFSDKTNFMLSWHHEDTEADDRQAHNPDYAGDGFFPANGKYESSFKIHEPYERDVDLFSLEATIDFGFATLTSATSYSDNDSSQTYDVSGFGEQFLWAYYYFFPRLTAPAVEETEDTGFVQEVRLASNEDGGKVDWIIGGFYKDSDNEYFSDNYVPGIREYYDALLGFDPGTTHGLIITRDLKTEETAVFGELTYHITEAWQVTGGARFFWQDFEQNLVQELPILGLFVPSVAVLTASNSEDFSDEVFKVNTSYNFSDTLKAYFTWSEGFRPGGANALPTAGPFAEDPELLSFDSDSATNYEIGVKGTIADRVRFSAAAFYITWDNFQFDTFAPVSGFQFVGNAEEARSQGLEFEVYAQVSDQLGLNLGYSYTDAELTEDFTASSVRGFDGDKMPGVPEHSLTWSGDYFHPLSGDYELRFHVNGTYRSETDSDWNPTSNFGRRFFEIDSFAIWDLSLSLAAGDRWTATLFADNIGNEEGITGGVPPENYGPRGAYFLVARPRTVGLRMSYSFDL